MRLIDVEKKLKALEQPLFHSSDAATLLNVSRAHASKMMNRLEECGALIRLTRGRWMISEDVERLLIPEFLTAPAPSYISLQTALFHHGMISQIPSVVYAITASKTRRYQTPAGVFSLHHVEPRFFFGFSSVGNHGIKMASPEKALIDFFYLSPARSKIFRTLPELEFPKGFSVTKAREAISQIHSESRRTTVEQKFETCNQLARKRPL